MASLSIVQAQRKEDDSVYSLFSDEMRDEYVEQPITPRRSGLCSDQRMLNVPSPD